MERTLLHLPANSLLHRDSEASRETSGWYSKGKLRKIYAHVSDLSIASKAFTLRRLRKPVFLGI